MLDNPGLARRSCDDCQTFIYIEDGPHKNQRVTRRGLPIVRNGSKPNCRQCPKESPAKAYKYNLSGKSSRVLEDYWRGRATQGLYFGGQISDRTSYMLSICERITNTHKDSSLMKMVVMMLQRSSI